MHIHSLFFSVVNVQIVFSSLASKVSNLDSSLEQSLANLGGCMPKQCVHRTELMPHCRILKLTYILWDKKKT